MKTKNLLLALCCIATLTACSNNDELIVPPTMRTVTLNVEVAEPADTRVAYTANEDGTIYKFAWSGGEKLRVFYNNGTNETYTDFEIDTYSDKQATFKGTLPDNVTKVTIAYHPTHYFRWDNNNVLLASTTPKGFQDLASALSERAYLYAGNVSVTEAGKLPNVKLQYAAAYLLLKAGIQVTDDDITLTSETTNSGFIFFNKPFYGYFGFSSSGMDIGPFVDQSLTAGLNCDVYVENGKLMHDILVPLILKEQTEVIPEVLFAMRGEDKKITKGKLVKQDSYKKTFEPGKIYEMKSVDQWLPSSFKE